MSNRRIRLHPFVAFCFAVLLGLPIYFGTARASITPSANQSFEACSQLFFQDKAPEVPNLEQWRPYALCNDTFAVMYSGLTKTPIFVAERLNKSQLHAAQNETRTNQFYADSRLPMTERAELEDYEGIGYDRGHMAPAGDMPTFSAMNQSFALSNVIPQAPQTNRGVWAKSVEAAVRKYVLRADGDVYVITGAAFSTGKTADPTVSRVWVPDFIYKLVYEPKTNKAWAYWLPNKDGVKVKGLISYQELVNRTGIDFIPAVKTTKLELPSKH